MTQHTNNLTEVIQAFSEKKLHFFLKNKIKGLTNENSSHNNLTAQHSTAQHSTAQHSTAQHSTAQHSTAQADFASVHLLGEAEFDDIDRLLVLAIRSNTPLTTRSGKKRQYELAKKTLKNENADAAIFVFYDADGTFRFSFIQADYIGTRRSFTSFRRYTYFVDKNQTNRTFIERIGSSDKWQSLDDILEAFSVEPLNKAFYQAIQSHFDKLKSDTCLTMSAHSSERAEFSVRLIGRLLFCWFLKNLHSGAHQPLIPADLLSQAKAQTEDYYSQIIEPLFFDTLNTPIDKRKTTLENHASIPYLNGGLFEKHHSDNGSDVKNQWFGAFFQTLSQYNFTIDENSSSDTEVSIDPEMLGTIFENLLAEQDPDTQKSARKASGSFYTPRVIVEYMAEQSVTAYLQQKTNIDTARILPLFGENINADNTCSADEKKQLLAALFDLKILDPACGSGAFPMGVMQKTVSILRHLDAEGTWWRAAHRRAINSRSDEAKALKSRLENANAEYVHKLGIVSRCLYGADIQPIAAEITKLRCFLSLIIDEKIDDSAENRGILPLPNLEFKFVTANSLLDLPKTSDTGDLFLKPEWLDELKTLRDDYLQSFGRTKSKAKKDFQEIQAKIQQCVPDDLLTQTNRLEENPFFQLAHWQPFEGKATNWFDPKWMFGVEQFDIVIGNPPYVSTKDVKSSDKKQLEAKYGFADDLYSHFFFRGMELSKPSGNLSYITSKTFWTIQTKRNVRDLLLSKKIDYIFDSANPFESAMVDTSIVGVSNATMPDNHRITFLDGREDLAQPHRYSIKQSAYQQAQNAVIFEPTTYNLAIYKKYNHKVKQLYKQWWGKIKTSRDIAKNYQELQDYRDSLKAGDIALLGCLTEGGQGLATANNGKYVAAKDTSKPAHNIRASRPKKLLEAIKKNKITEFQYIDNITKSREYLASLSENEITQLFDRLKDEYGRDIFGQGYLFRIVSDSDIADVDTLSDCEKQNGISPDKAFYVPYDKGDRYGNRWYLETPFAIAWSQENVIFLKSDPRARYQGYDFYFREGFCWTDVSGEYLKSRVKSNGVFDVLSMSLFTQIAIADFYFVSLINSRFMGRYLNAFTNNTVHFQINDARQLPIIIPNKVQLAEFEKLFERAVAVQKRKFAQTLTENEAEAQLNEIQTQLDNAVNTLYGVEPTGK